MRVLLLNTRPDFQSEWGGDTTQLMETHRELQQLGVSTQIAGVSVRDVELFDLVHIFNLQTLEKAPEALALLHAQKKPCVLSTIYWELDYALQSVECLRYGKSRLIRWLAHTYLPAARCLARVRAVRKQVKLKPLQRLALQHAKVLLPNSVTELEMLVNHFHLPSLRGKSCIVPNGVKTPVTNDLQPPEVMQLLPKPYVLEASSFHPLKGQGRLIKALMGDPQIPLVCLGRMENGAYSKHCQDLAKRRGNTFLLDRVPYEQMPCFYAKALVHALPSLRESPGLASLEAATYEANCVVGMHAPVWEYFEREAFVCDPEDTQSLRRAVISAWNTPRSSRLKARILKEFTWRIAAEETLRGYEWALQSATD